MKNLDWDKYIIQYKLKELIQEADRSVSSRDIKPIPPDFFDLARIHYLIRSRMVFTVLEFGVGYSTIVMADALVKNKEEWQNQKKIPKIRNLKMFKCFSVDTSQEWINFTLKRTPERLREYIVFSHSSASASTFRGQICHFYNQIPDVVPDFIYLDGPDPQQVTGKVNGCSFQCPERTVMSGDLLLMESTLLPGTFVLVDGRTNNARFLERNLSRNFEINWSKEQDVTTMELKEDRLGKYNLLGLDFFKQDRIL